MAMKLEYIDVGVGYLNSKNNVNEQGCTVVLVNAEEKGETFVKKTIHYDGKEFVKEVKDPVTSTNNAQKNISFINQNYRAPSSPSILSIAKQVSATDPSTTMKTVSSSNSSEIAVTSKLVEPANSTSSHCTLSSKQMHVIRLERSNSSDYKEELKKKILERRKAEGKNIINLAEEEEKRRKDLQNLNQLTQQDIEKRLQKRKNNCMAARRCREKKRLKGLKTEMDISIHQQRNEELKKAMEVLEMEKQMLQKIWREANMLSGNQVSQEIINQLRDKDYEKFIPKPIHTYITMNKESSGATLNDKMADTGTVQKNTRNEEPSSTSKISVNHNIKESVKSSSEVIRNVSSEKYGINSQSPKKNFQNRAIDSGLNTAISEKPIDTEGKEIEILDITPAGITTEKDAVTVIDLTEENSSVNDIIARDTKMNDFDIVQARSLLLEAAEAAYCEINYLEETSFRNTESSSQESSCISELTVDNDDKAMDKEDNAKDFDIEEEEDDDDDILPLVIDFDSDSK